jgi:hypothetical protein
MRQWIRKQVARLFVALTPKPDLKPRLLDLEEQLREVRRLEEIGRADYLESLSELQEASQMSGVGPWVIGPETQRQTTALLRAAAEAHRTGTTLKENAITSQGAFGDFDLALENIGWRRETSLSWLEFSRWGIQQIILICRLYYIKNPLIRRGVDVSASYVFGRGFELTSDNQQANDVLQAFLERNQRTLGQIALTELEKRKYYDGNLFFAFFADAESSGEVNIRTIDATEIQDIICNPDDSDDPYFYKRQWVETTFDLAKGTTQTNARQAYYPALDYEPEQRPEMIGGITVMWDTPVLHRKCGAIAKWHFGCPLIYPALPWAKTARRMLESIFTVKKALAQIAMTMTTKGGQQALQGAKQGLGTSVGPQNLNGAWDTQPSAQDGSIFASGPGTTLSAFKTAGAGGNPEDVRRYIHWVCICFGIPETWMADASVGTVATAMSLDRPTELGFMEKQEAWREDLTRIGKFALRTSNGAASGKLRNSLEGTAKDWNIIECARITKENGERVYEAVPKPKTIQVKVNFPAIREGDMPANIKAIAEAMTLDNKGGQVVGIDEKVGVGMLYAELGYENYQDVLDKQYPKKYDPDRTVEPLPAPIGKAEPDPGGEPQAPGGKDPKPANKQVAAAESRNGRAVKIRRLKEALKRLTRAA